MTETSKISYLIHVSSACGGAEKLSLEIARILSMAGYRVNYVVPDSRMLYHCMDLFDMHGNYKVIEVKSLREKLLSLTGKFRRLRRLLIARKLALYIDGLEGLKIDTGTDIPLGSIDISYIHYPILLDSKESRSAMWRLYKWYLKSLQSKVLGKPTIVLTNSTWTAKLIEDSYGVNAKVLHPPVDVDYFRYDGTSKENIIVTISRINLNKRIHLLPKIAKKLEDYEWYLIGSTYEYGSSRALRELEKQIRVHNASNFHVLTNLKNDELRKLLMRAKFYVHPQYQEHFGISVVEAMSAGAVPIVYRDGGAWVDVVSDISQELGYVELGEIPAIIRNLENNPRKLDELRETAVEKSMEYRREVFQEKFTSILEELLSQQ